MADIQLFCNVDGEGSIIDAYSGKNIIATEPFDFFFLIDEETASDIENFSVTIDGFKPKLERKVPNEASD